MSVKKRETHKSLPKYKKFNFSQRLMAILQN